MYSSNDRYFAAQMAAERREMMMQRSTRSSRPYCNQDEPQVRVAVMPVPTFFDSLRASLLPLKLLSSVMIISLIIIVSLLILALVLIPLGL